MGGAGECAEGLGVAVAVVGVSALGAVRTLLVTAPGGGAWIGSGSRTGNGRPLPGTAGSRCACVAPAGRPRRPESAGTDRDARQRQPYEGIPAGLWPKPVARLFPTAHLRGPGRQNPILTKVGDVCSKPPLAAGLSARGPPQAACTARHGIHGWLTVLRRRRCDPVTDLALRLECHMSELAFPQGPNGPTARIWCRWCNGGPWRRRSCWMAERSSKAPAGAMASSGSRTCTAARS